MIARSAFFSAILLLLSFFPTADAQQLSPLEIAQGYLAENREKWQLSPEDISDLQVTDQYATRHNGLTHIYLIQQHQGIGLFNAISGLHIDKQGRVVFATNRFTPNLASRINTTEPLLGPCEAIESAAAHLGLAIAGELQLKEQKKERFFTFEGGNISDSDIGVQLAYQLMPGGAARLAWRLAIDHPDGASYWNLRVDALTGEVLSKDNWTAHCVFPSPAGNSSSLFDPPSEARRPPSAGSLREGGPQTDAQYRVFPIPLENPADGGRELLINPHDALASPYGWHDTDGQDGPEYLITRGNNVHAYQDSNGSNISAGDEPGGGPGLLFDFPLGLSQEPETYRDASVTQLFYLNNFMHDLAYAYGFDEPAGNFQQNNYGNGGAAGDYVAAEAQDGSDINNANFTTPPDGAIGRMQMFQWNSPGPVFSVTAPEPIAGAYEVRPALFGGQATAELLAGALVEYDDGSARPALACAPARNAAELNGNVALIDRGDCDFDRKALNAQNAGAVAAIICNYADALVNMGPVSVGNQVNIPVVSMRYSNCLTLRQFLGQGVEVAFQLPDDSGPARLDGSLDNVVVAHEYTHGISNRLVGGPSSVSCLSNDEQMGEGWSDFLSMAITVKPGDTGARPRTYANYVLRQGADGAGLRRQPYSTDMGLNNQDYEDIVGTAIYQDLGEVWAVMLWDLYWKLAEAYGWDEDPIYGNGGNNLAIQLVMDAMKLQACEPGFTDGRDALLAADAMNNGGANACYIWEVFARRGLGYSADQGSRFDRNDGLAAFDMLPECVKELKISKMAGPLVDAGAEIHIMLAVTNHKEEAVSGVVARDELPAGTAYVAGSAAGAPFEVAGGEILFNIGDMAPGESLALSYRLSTDMGAPSVRQFLDDMESGADNWLRDNLNGLDLWSYSDNDAYSGGHSWFVRNTAGANDQALQLKDAVTVTGARPALRFYHRYETEAGLDGGFVEVSTDGGLSWGQVQELVARGPYPRPMAASTLSIPGLRAYSGSSAGGWLDTYVDLSSYLGEELLVRFRFGSSVSGAPNAFNPGWYVDDVEFLDMVHYNGEACVSSSGGDLACTRAPFLGTVVESAVVSGNQGEEPALALELFPNPVRNILNIMLQLEAPARLSVSLAGMDGRMALERKMEAAGGYQLLPLDVSGLPPGFYVVKVSTGGMVWTGKVVVKG